jgi:uncharacterized delta-60 repeat protein
MLKAKRLAARAEVAAMIVRCCGAGRRFGNDRQADARRELRLRARFRTMWHSRPRLWERKITAEGGCATWVPDNTGRVLKQALNDAVAEALERRMLLSGVTTLATFNGTDGSNPSSGLVLSGGILYGTTTAGGADSDGEVFSLPVAGGTPTVLASFDGADGDLPLSGLVISGSTLFGTTFAGGADDVDGEVYSLPESGGTPTVLASFNGADGSNPEAGLSVVGGILYGTTSSGGAHNDGEVFSVPIGGGTPTILASFNGTDGSSPEAGLTVVGNILYGTTEDGGADNEGVVFSLPIAGGTPTVLASFNGDDGAEPLGAMIVSGSTLFGTTFAGGADSEGVVFSLPIAGGTPTVLASFDGSAGADPNTDLAAFGSSLFGSTFHGGANGEGTIFSLPLAGGTPAVLASLSDNDTGDVAGDEAAGGLAIDSVGDIFASTFAGGGSNNDGTVFEVTPAAPVLPPASIGNLDPQFGVGGIASHNIGFASTAGEAVQSNGATVIAGTAGSAGSKTFALTRYNADGSLDTTFGDDGVTDTSFGGDDQASAEALLPNGDILVAGTDSTKVHGQTIGSQFAVAEYTSSGVLNTSFGDGTGQVLASFSTTSGTLSNDVVHGLSVAPNGTIYVVGSTDANGGQDFAIAAFNADGSPATGFGTSGKTAFNFQGGDDSADAVTVQSNGDLIVAGSTQNPSTDVISIALARLLPNGALDSHFGSKGKVITSIGGVDDEATSVTLQPKGQIVVGGESATGSISAGTLASNFAVLRYTSTGKLDHTFNRSGFVVTSFGQDAAVTKVLVQSDGKIVASGKTISAFGDISQGNLGIAVARYNTNGTLDSTFNGGKTSITLTGGSATASLQRPLAIAPSDSLDTLRQQFEAFIGSAQGIIAATPGGDLAVAGNSGGFTEEGELVAMGIDLAASLLAKPPASLKAGASVAITIDVTEDGSSPASGVVTVEVFLSDSSTVEAGDTQVFSKAETLKLNPRQAKSYAIRLKVPVTLSAGNYDFVAEVATDSLRDLNPSNNIAFKGPFAIP